MKCYTDWKIYHKGPICQKQDFGLFPTESGGHQEHLSRGTARSVLGIRKGTTSAKVKWGGGRVWEGGPPGNMYNGVGERS